MKQRIDKLLVERGYFPSRERAQAIILAGRVLVNGQKIEKSGASVDDAAEIRILGDDQKYVSRGGFKLERAIEHWKIPVAGRIAMDVGASTGGFTDCFLQHGAARVIAVDTGYGQIAGQLRDDPRVRLLERTNARYLEPSQVGEPVDILAMDVSFISATLVLAAVIRSAFVGAGESPGRVSSPEPYHLVVLVKPQFEVGREKVGKGGIVRDAAAQQSAVDRVSTSVRELGGWHIEVIESPILGTEGNREFLLHSEFPRHNGSTG